MEKKKQFYLILVAIVTSFIVISASYFLTTLSDYSQLSQEVCSSISERDSQFVASCSSAFLANGGEYASN